MGDCMESFHAKTEMMGTDLYLKDLATTLYKFQQENILCDTVLIAEDNCKVWAHSVILAAVSPHIYTNFLSITGHKAKCRFSMKLSGCSVACVEAVLHFLYTGSLVLPSSFQHPDQFSGILIVCERMGIDVAKLNGVAVRFGDVSSLETSDLMVCEESIHGAAAFNACLDTEDTLDTSVGKESGSTEMVECVCDANLLSKEGESSLLENSVKLKTEENFASDQIDNDKPDLTGFEQATNCSDSLKMESSDAVEPSFIIINHYALPGTMPSTCKTSKIVSRKVPQGSPGAWVSVLKGSKASAVRRSTSIRLAAKVLQKIGMKKNRTVEGNLRTIHNESNRLDSVHSETEQLMNDKDNMTLSCPVRERQFTSQSSLRKRLGEHTSDQSMLACKLCNKVFTSVQRLQAHEKMHAGDRPHVCTTCGKTYRFRSSLIQHSHAHNEKRPYLCDICGTGFALAVNLRRHKMARHSNVRPFVCSECGRGFVRDYLLRQHMENHTGQRSNICPLCGKSFSHRGNLNRHLRNHDGEKQHICIVCGRAFNRKSNMEKHVLCHTRHNSILTHKRNELRQQHVCNECQKVFRSAKILSRHATLHSSENSFACDVCAKRFTTSRYLQQHQVVHQEKQFKCNVCAKMFASENFLSGHMRKFHSDFESFPGD